MEVHNGILLATESESPEAACPVCGKHVPDSLVWHLSSVHGYKFQDVWYKDLFYTKCPCGVIVQSSHISPFMSNLYRHVLDGGIEHHMLCLLISRE